MHEIPKILTEKEFAKRLQLAKETLNEYNCKNDIEKRTDHNVRLGKCRWPTGIYTGTA